MPVTVVLGRPVPPAVLLGPIVTTAAFAMGWVPLKSVTVTRAEEGVAEMVPITAPVAPCCPQERSPGLPSLPQARSNNSADANPVRSDSWSVISARTGSLSARTWMYSARITVTVATCGVSPVGGAAEEGGALGARVVGAGVVGGGVDGAADMEATPSAGRALPESSPGRVTARTPPTVASTATEAAASRPVRRGLRREPWVMLAGSSACGCCSSVKERMAAISSSSKASRPDGGKCVFMRPLRTGSRRRCRAGRSTP